MEIARRGVGQVAAGQRRGHAVDRPGHADRRRDVAGVIAR